MIKKTSPRGIVALVIYINNILLVAIDEESISTIKADRYYVAYKPITLSFFV